MKTEYAENGGFLQRDSVEHEEYAEAYSTESREVDRKDGADLLEKVLCRDNLNKAYKRVKANKINMILQASDHSVNAVAGNPGRSHIPDLP